MSHMVPQKTRTQKLAPASRSAHATGDPLASTARKLTPRQGSELEATMAHQRAERSNLVDFLGGPVKKPTRLLTAAIMLGARLNNIRCDNT
eukprot:4681110-Pyramimonas_sp.AAC.1